MTKSLYVQCPQCSGYLLSGSVFEGFRTKSDLDKPFIQCNNQKCKWKKVLANIAVASTLQDEIMKLASPSKSLMQVERFKFLYFWYVQNKHIVNIQTQNQYGHDLVAHCEDVNGNRVQFKGKAALNIIYYCIKDKWFEAKVTLQKFWKKGRHYHWGYAGNKKAPIKDFVTHFHQRIKMLGMPKPII